MLLKEFTQSDWHGFSGASKFCDGREPLIAHVGEYTIIVGGNGDSRTQTLVEIQKMERDEFTFAQRVFSDTYYLGIHKGIDIAIKYGEFLANNPELIESLETLEEA